MSGEEPLRTVALLEEAGHALTDDQREILAVFDRWFELPDDDAEKPGLRARLRERPDTRELVDEHERQEALTGGLLRHFFRYDALPDVVFWVDAGRDGWVMANTVTRAAVRLPVARDRHARILDLLWREVRADPALFLRLIDLVGDGLGGRFEFFTECAPTDKEARS